MNYTADIGEIDFNNDVTIDIKRHVIEINSMQDISSIHVYNLNSQIMSVNVLSDSYSLDTYYLPKGVCILQVVMSDGNNIVKKFVNY